MTDRQVTPEAETIRQPLAHNPVFERDIGIKRRRDKVFKRIMVPVDLAHAGELTRALQCAADLAQHYKATIVYVGVTSATPGSVAHTPAEFAQKMTAFADEQGKKSGVETEGLALTSHDPKVDLDPTLLKAVEDTDADLVVMASHIPNLVDYVWPSNGGTVATRAKVSVMVVR